MAGHLSTELVVGALEMAAKQRKLEETLHDSDQGTQYTAIDSGERCTAEGVRPQRKREATATTTQCESFLGTLECELLERETFATRSEARLSIFTFIEG